MKRAVLQALFIFFGIVLFGGASHAADIYFAQTSAGLNNGTSCANAYAYNDGTHGLGTAGPWTAGNVLHICGTFSMTAGASGTITAQGDGSSGNVIRIQFETGANATAAYWGPGGFITINGHSFIQIDGSPTSTPCGYVNSIDTNCNGEIQATANGALLANHVANSHGVSLGSGTHDIEVRNLDCENLFVAVQNNTNNETTSGINNSACVWWYPSGGGGGGNINVHNLKVNYSFNGILFAYQGANSGMHADNNWMDHIEVGVQEGAGSSGSSVSTGSVNNNDFADMAVWDTSNSCAPNCPNHHEFIHLYTNQTSSSVGSSGTPFLMGGNYFHGTLGYALTSEIYIECVISTEPCFVLRYNNVVVNTDPNAAISTGVGGNGMTECSGGTCQDYNNTYYSDAHYSTLNFAQHVENSGVLTAQNNIYDGMNSALVNGGGGSTITASNNLGFGLNVSCGASCSVSGNPLLNLSSTPPYQLQAGSAAGSVGNNLTALGYAGLDFDQLGSARPGGATAWDMGAFNLPTSGSVTLTPTSQNFGSVTVGLSSSNFTFTLTNTTASSVTGISVSNVGGNTADFPNVVAGTTCTTTLAASSSCNYIVKFSPSIVGAESTTLTFTDSAGSQTSALSGTGVAAGTVTVAPTSQNFGSVSTGSSSANFSFTITSTLSSSTSLSISNVGGNTADFPNVVAGTTCTSTLPASSSCTYIAKFSPSITGAESTTLTVVDSAGTQTSALSGTGVGPVTLTPTTFNFGSWYNLVTSTVNTFTLSNSSGATITSITITKVGGNTVDFSGVAAGGSPCGTSLANGSTCTINSAFTPQAAGARSTTLTVNYTGGSVGSALSGTGVTPPTPPTPVFNYSADDYGGLTTVSCSGHPHALPIISASQSGTTQTVVVSSVTNFAVNEAMLISGTGTAMDWVFVPKNVTDGASYITAINSGTHTLTLTATASHTVGTVSIGTIRPGRFYIQTVTTAFGTGPQFCTPENHWMWLTTVGAAGGAIFQGSGATTTRYDAKYGGSCNATQALQAEFVNTLNFNSIGPDPDPTYLLNGACTNTKLSTFTDNDVSVYSAVNLGGYVSQPLLDMNAMVDNFYNASGAVNAPMVDYFNPNWESFISQLITKFNSNTNNNYRNPHFLGTPGDDTDFTKLPDAGGDFHTIPISHASVDPALQIMVTSPLLTLEAVPTANIYGGGQPTPYVFTNPVNFSKTPMVSPPGSCNVVTICDLFDFVKNKYTTVGALNTAWGTSGFYTTFGSSGVCHGYSYSWCGSTTTAASFAGTGATTYTPTLSSVTAPHSVQILLNGTAIGGDCPFYSSLAGSGCTGSAGTGNLKGPGVWKASLALPTGFVRTDSNGNIEIATVGGTSAASTPSWPATCTGTQTTTDGSVTWTCLGPGIAAASTITYATGATSIVFNSALSGSYTVTINYMQNGWTTGTGLMDEDGRNTSWIGTNYVCLIQRPAFATTHVYSVNDEIHDATSGTWQIVTVPGTSGSSTPTFSATQGNFTTTGGVTFESLGLPVCGTETGSDFGAINANQTFAADMVTWLQQEAGAYFGGIQTAYHTNYPDLLYGAADNVGVWNTPPRAAILIAAQTYSDWVYTGTFIAPNYDPNANVKNSFQTQYYQRPMVTYHALASTQSIYGCDGNPLCFATQALKGNQYFLNTQAQLNTLSYSGTFQWAGMQWWGSGPFQSSDFGFKSSVENSYDGHENVVASVPCSPPLAAYTCGGEPPSSSWLGVNLSTSVAAANLLWTQGTSSGTLTFTPTSLNFGSLPLYIPSGILQVQVTNTGTISVTVSSVTISGAPFALQTSLTAPDCRTVGSIAVGASCYIAANVTPAIVGTVAGSVMMADSATGSPQTVPLAAIGLAVPPAPNAIFGDLP